MDEDSLYAFGGAFIGVGDGQTEDQGGLYFRWSALCGKCSGVARRDRSAPCDGAALCGEAYNEGSSVGVYIVKEAANGPPCLAPDLPEVLMVETYAPGGAS